MAEKLTFKVSEIGGNDAGYFAIEEISSDRTDTGDVVFVYPGTYTDPNTANVGGLTIVGVGNRDDVVFSGFTIPATTTGTVTLQNLRINAGGLTIGNAAVTVNVVDCKVTGTAGPARSAALATGNAAITKGVAGATYAVVANSTLVVENSSIESGSEYGIRVEDYGTVTLRNSIVKADAGILSNGACTIEHSTFTGANNYVSTIAAPITAPTHIVRASVSAAANAGNNTETVVALIS
tara:strand:- start:2511 stop:3221 length:711 start_codon:yes stop_codon:yes gene_type:complete